MNIQYMTNNLNWIGISVTLTVFCLALVPGSDAEILIPGSTFSALARADVRMSPSNITFINLTRPSCARECHKRPVTCFSFTYELLSLTCRLGLWIVPEATTTNTAPLYQYSSGSVCNTSANFQILSNGKISVCVWASDYLTTYNSAMIRCQARGAHLYTVRSMEKLNILNGMITGTDALSTFWIGLDDIVREDEFVWVDDGSVLRSSWRRVLFTDGQPNGKFIENCVGFYPLSNQIHDFNCDSPFRFICEINPTML